MYSWTKLSQTMDQHGNPRQFFNAEGELFIICLQRVTGPSDDTIPRRVVGMGATRALAVANVVESMRAYDSSGTIMDAR